MFAPVYAVEQPADTTYIYNEPIDYTKANVCSTQPLLQRNSGLNEKTAEWIPFLSTSNSQLKAIDAFVERVGKSVMTQAQSFLQHSPTMSNYWHVEFQLKPSIDDPVFKNIKAGWKETLFHTYRKACFGFIEKDSIEIIPIEEGWYKE